MFYEQGGLFSQSWLQPAGWRAVWESVLDPAGEEAHSTRAGLTTCSLVRLGIRTPSLDSSFRRAQSC